MIEHGGPSPRRRSSPHSPQPRGTAMQRVKDGAARGALPQHPGLVAPERLVGLGFRYWLTGFRTRRHLLLGEGLARLLQRAGRRRGQGRRHRPLLLGARHQPPCAARSRNRRRRLRALLPRRVHRHRDDLGLPAQRLPGHARLRLRAARLLADRRGRARARKPSPRPCAAPTRSCRHPSVMAHRCWRCRRPAPCDSERVGEVSRP